MPKTGGFPFVKHPKRPKRSGPPRKRSINRATFISQSRAMSSEQKAMFHNILGAGPKGTIRKFFDLNTSDQTALMNGLEKLVAARIRKA